MLKKLIRWAIRQRTRKGHGVHSPFAFRLITDVVCSPHPFYAFDDIDVLLGNHQINPERVSRFHHLSFKMVNALKPQRVLVVEDAEDINTPFVLAPHPSTRCVRIAPNGDETDNIRVAIRTFPNPVENINHWDMLPSELFDAIVISALNHDTSNIDKLLSLTNPTGFWVITSNSAKNIKPFRQNIVKDNRIRVIFDMKDILIVCLNPHLSKKTYYL